MQWQQADLEFAVELTRDCARLARRVQLRMVTGTLQKEDRSPVTIADFSVQALAGKRLGDRYPGIALVAEESAAALRRPDSRPMVEQIAEYLAEFETGASPDHVLSWIDRGQGPSTGRFWVLDPVDGTKGFLRDAQYVVALALIDRGEVVLGVLGCPRLGLDGGKGELPGDLSEEGCLVVAGRGEGAWCTRLTDSRFRRLHVSTVSNPAEAVVVRSIETGHTNVDQLRLLLQELGVSTEAVPMDSQAKYALLADGYGDLLTRLISPSNREYREKIWDQAAGTIVVEEAGGRVTDLDGMPLDFTTGRRLERNRGVLATNGHLHDAALEALARVEDRHRRS